MINAQSSIKINDKYIIYFDPFMIKDKINDADIIFITHDHYDHFDNESINNIINDNTKIVIPKSIKEVVLNSGINENRLMLVEPNNEYNILCYDFKTIPSYNINKSFHSRDKNYVGYLININDNIIYVSGDMDASKEAREVKCDIALIPIGGTYTMDYKEASVLINEIKPKIVIPTHYKTIVGSDMDAKNFKELINKDIECVIKL